MDYGYYDYQDFFNKLWTVLTEKDRTKLIKVIGEETTNIVASTTNGKKIALSIQDEKGFYEFERQLREKESAKIEKIEFKNPKLQKLFETDRNFKCLGKDWRNNPNYFNVMPFHINFLDELNPKDRFNAILHLTNHSVVKLGDKEHQLVFNSMGNGIYTVKNGNGDGISPMYRNNYDELSLSIMLYREKNSKSYYPFKDLNLEHFPHLLVEHGRNMKFVSKEEGSKIYLKNLLDKSGFSVTKKHDELVR